MEGARDQPPPRREQREDVVRDELRPVAPRQAVGEVLQLEPGEEDEDGGALGMVLEQAAVVGSGSAVSSEGGPELGPELPEDAAGAPAHAPDREAAQGVHADVARQDAAARLVEEDRMEVLRGGTGRGVSAAPRRSWGGADLTWTEARRRCRASSIAKRRQKRERTVKITDRFGGRHPPSTRNDSTERRSSFGAFSLAPQSVPILGLLRQNSFIYS
uniref:Uncharacterized protein n=1 Tax=Corethron hystrix TaxID=216773 RepID=A0A7S1FXI7_9STRA|mmetsp:Transcript_39851/g.93420  ORF Transcript_39851/g.93420 Transcript_39851/m.93420 type:complete len:216 (+) Transcript_39851:576-1223(+)